MSARKPISEAGSWKAPQRGNGAAAVGTAAALLLLLAFAGCEGTDAVRNSAYFPETVSVGSSFGREDGIGWDRETVGVSFTWRLKTRTVIPVPPPTPEPEKP